MSTYPSPGLVAVVYKILRYDYHVEVSPTVITDYIVDMNENVDFPYIESDAHDAECIASQIYSSMEVEQ